MRSPGRDLAPILYTRQREDEHAPAETGGLVRPMVRLDLISRPNDSEGFVTDFNFTKVGVVFLVVEIEAVPFLFIRLFLSFCWCLSHQGKGFKFCLFFFF